MAISRWYSTFCGLFLHACELSTGIQNYACRQSEKKGKFDHFKDLLEGLVDFLISFVLDALGLYRDELLRTPDEHKRSPNRGKSCMERSSKSSNNESFGDIRTYHFDLEISALPPSKKKRVVIEDTKGSGIGTTKEDLVVQKTECVEDEVEDIEEA